MAGPGSSNRNCCLSGGVATKLPYTPSPSDASADLLCIGIGLGRAFVNGPTGSSSEFEFSESGLDSTPMAAGEFRRETRGSSKTPSYLPAAEEILFRGLTGLVAPYRLRVRGRSDRVGIAGVRGAAFMRLTARKTALTCFLPAL